VKLLVGLGNPGRAYAGTRHNIGFMVADRLAKRWVIQPKKDLCRSRMGEGVVKGCAVAIACPQTMMNESGTSVGCLVQRFSIELSEILVVCDDVALPLGVIRLRGAGSDGGHRGLASILKEVQTEAVPRLRVGIGRSGQDKRKDLTGYVLGKFTASEKKKLEEACACSAEACETWVVRGLTTAMNLFNGVKGCL